MDRLGARLPRDHAEEGEAGEDGGSGPRAASRHAGTSAAKTQARHSTKVRSVTGGRTASSPAIRGRCSCPTPRGHEGGVERRAEQRDRGVARRRQPPRGGAAERPGAVEEEAVDRADAPADGGRERHGRVDGDERGVGDERQRRVGCAHQAEADELGRRAGGTRGRGRRWRSLQVALGVAGGWRARRRCASGSSRSAWITFGICGIAPSASHAVRTMHAPASARVRASAANGRTHHTYQGIVQPSVRTAASITKPAAPGSHARRHGRPRRPRRRPAPARRGRWRGRRPSARRGRRARRARWARSAARRARPGCPSRAGGRRRPARRRARTSAPAPPAPPRAGRRRRQAEHDDGREQGGRGLEARRRGRRTRPRRRPTTARSRACQPTIASATAATLQQQHERLVVRAADAVDEDERVQPDERDRGLRRAPEPPRGERHQHERPQRGGQHDRLPRPVRRGQRRAGRAPR